MLTETRKIDFIFFVVFQSHQIKQTNKQKEYFLYVLLRKKRFTKIGNKYFI